MTSHEQHDVTRMRDQPQLTTASGTLWVVVGGASATVFIIMFVVLWQALGDTIALAGAVAVGALFAGMLVVRFLIPAGRTRLLLLAADVATLLMVAAVFAFLVLAGQ